MITIVAEATAKPGHEAAVRSALDVCARFSRAEPNNVVYQPLQEADRPSRFLIYEIWRDEAAIAAHNETDHFKALIGAVEPLCEHLAIRKLEWLPGRLTASTFRRSRSGMTNCFRGRPGTPPRARPRSPTRPLRSKERLQP